LTTTSIETWLPCNDPDISDTIRWREPLWAVPTKARGKRDKIGMQMVTAKLIARDEPAELLVIDVQQLSLMSGITDAPSNIKKNDMIRRKAASILSGGCEKLVQGV
jgi:hypothetical protein